MIDDCIFLTTRLDAKKFKISQIQFEAKSTPDQNAELLIKNYQKSMEFHPNVKWIIMCVQFLLSRPIILIQCISAHVVVFTTYSIYNRVKKVLIGL